MAQFRIDTPEKIKLRLRARDKNLLAQNAFAKSDYVSRLGRESDSSQLVGLYTPRELKDMLGYISLASSDTKGLKLQKELETLYDHISRTMARHNRTRQNSTS